MVKLATSDLGSVPAGTMTSIVCRVSSISPTAKGVAKRKSVMALRDSGATVNSRLLLHGPAPRALAARTFQVRRTLSGSSKRLVYESRLTLAFLSNCVLPL